MDLNQQKEQFSNAYLRAVAAAAGFTCYKPEVDSDSIDWGIAAVGGNGTQRSPRLELQLKSTATDVLGEKDLTFPLKLKNYEDLRADNFLVPRILVVVSLPDDVVEWLNHSEDELAMRHCGYWCSIRGYPDTENETKVSIKVPRLQQFTVEALTEIMKRIGAGGYP